jgi:hypothetical protein
MAPQSTPGLPWRILEPRALVHCCMLRVAAMPGQMAAAARCKPCLAGLHGACSRARVLHADRSSTSESRRFGSTPGSTSRTTTGAAPMCQHGVLLCQHRVLCCTIACCVEGTFGYGTTTTSSWRMSSALRRPLTRHRFAILLSHTRIHGTQSWATQGYQSSAANWHRGTHRLQALTDGILHEAAGTHRYAVAGLDPNEPLVVGLSFGAFMSVTTPTPIPIPATVSDRLTGSRPCSFVSLCWHWSPARACAHPCVSARLPDRLSVSLRPPAYPPTLPPACPPANLPAYPPARPPARPPAYPRALSIVSSSNKTLWTTHSVRTAARAHSDTGCVLVARCREAPAGWCPRRPCSCGCLRLTRHATCNGQRS